jgi:hypothetical protein
MYTNNPFVSTLAVRMLRKNDPAQRSRRIHPPAMRPTRPARPARVERSNGTVDGSIPDRAGTTSA